MDVGACSGTFLSPTLLGGIFNAVCVFGVLRTDRRLCTCSQATTTARISPDAQVSTAIIENCASQLCMFQDGEKHKEHKGVLHGSESMSARARVKQRDLVARDGWRVGLSQSA